MIADFTPRTQFQTAIPNSTHLVSTEFVRAVRGVSAATVQNMVETGRFRFVWDINTQQGRHRVTELRFWLQEIISPLPATFTLADALKIILGERRTSWRGVEVAQMLLVSRPCIHRLHKTRALPGTIANNTLWIQRAALEEFLRARWLEPQIL